MKTFHRLIFIWCSLAIMLDLGTIFIKETKQSDKQSAAVFGMINCLCLYFIYDKAWGTEDKKKPKPKP